MLSGPVLKQFRTYLKSQIGNRWSVEGRQSKRRYLTRVSFRYLSGERSVVLLDIDFDADNQDEIVRTVKRLSELMRERNIDLAKAKELICGGKIDNNGKAGINWIALTDEFQNEERGNTAVFYPREWGEDAFHQWSPEKIDFYLKEGTK